MGANRRLTARDLLQSRTRDWPEAVTPVTRLMMLLFRLSDLALANATTAMAAHGLRFGDFQVLATLRGAPPPHELAPTDLYDALLISSGGMTKVLASLERRKLVSRPAAAEDDAAGRCALPPRPRAGGARLGRRRARRRRIRRPGAHSDRHRAPRRLAGEAACGGRRLTPGRLLKSPMFAERPRTSGIEKARS